MSAEELLARLVGFPTVSSESNLDLLAWVEGLVGPAAPGVRRFANPGGDKANLLLSFGPDEPGGLVLSGHTDVVPVEGQAWRSDPFRLREAGGRLIGRGACDMKGFLACCLALVPEWGMLRRPVHLALSYDEEVGCTGVGPMAEWAGRLAPAVAVIGEPSRMQLVHAHKGGLIGWGHVTGRPGHSSQPDRAVNAVMAGAECIVRFGEARAALRAGRQDTAFDPPHSTVQVNLVEGGTGKNIVAEACDFFWEMRVLPGEDDRAVLAGIEARIGAEVVPAMQAVDRGCGVRFSVDARIPALAPNADGAAEARLLALLGQDAAMSVPYGSEAGIFQLAGVPSVILGPGDIAQAHQPEEFVERSQLAACVAVLRRVVGEFCG